MFSVPRRQTASGDLGRLVWIARSSLTELGERWNASASSESLSRQSSSLRLADYGSSHTSLDSVRRGDYTLDFLLATRNAWLARRAGSGHAVDKSPEITASADRSGIESCPGRTRLHA